LVGVTDAGKLALVLLCGTAGMAQQRTISARAGTINYQQGTVYVDDQPVHPRYGLAPLQMKNDQRLRIDNGRVELLLGSGVYLRMLGASSIRMLENHLDDTRVLVETGSVLIEVAGMNRGAQLRIVCGEVTTRLQRDGLYRFDAPVVATMGKLRIYKGDAVVEREGISVKGKSGLAVELAHDPEVSKFDSKENDALEVWAARRSQRRIDTERRRAQARALEAAKHRVQVETQ
jgi:hypothetical protein